MLAKSDLALHIRHVLRVLILLAPLGLIPYLYSAHYGAIRAFVYDQLRNRGLAVAVARTKGFQSVESDHFILKYEPADADVAPMVLRTAESFYDPVTKDLGYTPPGKVLLVLYPDREELRNAFGWPSAEDAMGVYWTGVIRILSPKAWIPTDDPVQMEQAFRSNGPIAHEFTHYVLDYRTSGNYPRWFTEGMAQYEEHRLTGFVWIEPESSLDHTLYSLSDLSKRFDRLDNQALAYREAFSLVSFISAHFGPDKLHGVIGDLATGFDLDQSLRRQIGITGPDLEKAWLTWVYDHPNRWNQ